MTVLTRYTGRSPKKKVKAAVQDINQGTGEKMEHLMKRIGFQKIGIILPRGRHLRQQLFLYGHHLYVLTDPINGTLSWG